MDKITPAEVTNNYYKRTFKHILRVQKNGLFLIDNFKDRLGLSNYDINCFMDNLRKHDASKFNDAQFHAYAVYFGNKPEERTPVMEANFQEAWKNHYETENHHPEGFLHGSYGEKIVGYEIACDLQAMSQEFNNSCRDYFEFKWRKENSKYVIDDFSWGNLQIHIRECIKCFEEYSM